MAPMGRIKQFFKRS